MRNLVIGSFFLSLAGSIWGGMFIAVRLSIFVIPPVPLVWMRYGTALLALIILMLMTHSSWHIDKKDCKLLVLSALSGQVLSIVTQETGTMMTSAQTGSVITAATPAFMVVFGYFLLHEKLTAGRIASVLLATIGVLFVVFDPDNFTVNPLGGASLFVAAVTWAFMSVLLKFLSKYSVITVTFYSVLIAFLTLTPYGLYWLLTAADYAAMASPSVWGSVLYLASSRRRLASASGTRASSTWMLLLRGSSCSSSRLSGRSSAGCCSQSPSPSISGSASRSLRPASCSRCAVAIRRLPRSSRAITATASTINYACIRSLFVVYLFSR
mgnify:FL=1